MSFEWNMYGAGFEQWCHLVSNKRNIRLLQVTHGIVGVPKASG